MGNMSRIPKIILAAAIVWVLFVGQAIAASSSSAPDTGVSPQKEQNALVNQLNQLTGSKVRMGTHALTGKVRYIGVDPSNPIRQPAALSAKPTPEEAARGFLSTYGTLFGLVDQARELSVMQTKSAEQGGSFVRFQQVHSGIPVLGGELIVQVNSSNQYRFSQWQGVARGIGGCDSHDRRRGGSGDGPGACFEALWREV
jgi:hypothetical protein